MNRAQLIADLKRDEGLRLRPYECTAGKTTIGIGRNLDDVGITEAEAELLCNNDIDRCAAELDRALPWWRSMTEPRQRALLNMCFNLGISRLTGFTNTLQALKDGQYEDAARHALNSRWAQQVGARSRRVADQIRRG